MDVREKLKEKGATERQLESRVVDMLEEILAEDSGFVKEAGRERQERLLSEIIQWKEEMQEADGNASRTAERLEEAVGKAERMDLMVRGAYIEDQRMVDRLNVFLEALRGARKIFGEENMTIEVIEKSMECACRLAVAGTE